MKKITIIVDDNITLGDLSALISVAQDVRIETLDTPVSSKRNVSSRRVLLSNSTAAAVMGHFTPSGHFTSRDAEAWVEKAGYNPSSGSPACSVLVRDGYLTRLGKGRFQFVKPYPSQAAI